MLLIEKITNDEIYHTKNWGDFDERFWDTKNLKKGVGFYGTYTAPIFFKKAPNPKRIPTYQPTTYYY